MSATPLSADQVLSLAPDAASAKAGAALATARKWSALGGDGEGRAVWGACQGSGAQPYRTQVDLGDLATRCSCPSRKFPCKHALALLLLLVAEPELFRVAERPAWVTEWLDGRSERTERKREREREAPRDEPARERRAAARADKIAAGLTELSRWLEDLVRGGLTTAAARPASLWDTAAARLVDAQAPGAARLVRQCAAIVAGGGEWPERLVAAIARLHLLAEAYGRLTELPDDVQADVRAALGWSPASDDLAGLPTVGDAWLVVGQVVEEEDRLRSRRTWLVGRASRRHALLLHFAHGTAPFADALPPVGGVLAAELAFFPGTTPLRAAIRARSALPNDAVPDEDGAASNGAALPPGHARIADATHAWAAALAANPWTERVALVLSAAVPERRGERWLVRDADGDALPIAPRFRAAWPLVALGGGRPVCVVGEWDGDVLLPLAAAAPAGPLVSLAQPLAVPLAVPA